MTMHRFVTLGWMITAALAGTARADRPSADAAKQAAEAWVAALDDDKPDAAQKLTAAQLFGAAYSDGPNAGCKPQAATTPAAITKLLGCLHGKIGSSVTLEPWTKQAAKELDGPLRQHKAKLAALEKTATLVHAHDKCVGEGQDVIIAVGADAKVVAALVQHVTCGE
ncbi:MAG TPA: hypothetical protein VF469_41850 [Kofleriaceae bacterium]